jgi:hypothetical protein
MYSQKYLASLEDVILKVLLVSSYGEGKIQRLFHDQSLCAFSFLINTLKKRHENRQL